MPFDKQVLLFMLIACPFSSVCGLAFTFLQKLALCMGMEEKQLSLARIAGLSLMSQVQLLDSTEVEFKALILCVRAHLALRTVVQNCRCRS